MSFRGFGGLPTVLYPITRMTIDLLLCDNLEQDLDSRCEELIKEEFGEDCNFDVDDAVQKLEKLGILDLSFL